MAFNERRRVAFSLVELLVAIAIVAVLLGAIVFAVQKARESAARLQCANNLRQLVVACRSYHDRHGTLPRNGAQKYLDQSDGPFGTGCCGLGGPRWSWIARVLPDLDGGDLAARAKIPEGDMDTAAALDVIARTLPVLNCPSDDSPRTRTDVANVPEGIRMGVTSYKGVSGSNWGAHGYPVDSNFECPYPNRGANGSFNGLEKGDGAFWRSDIRAGRLKLTQIKDGLSVTFIMGEDVPSLNLWNAWAHANTSNATCAIPPNTGVAIAPLGPEDKADWELRYSFRSRHPGGLHFACADGSVHFVSQEISLQTYRALATLAGEEHVELPNP